MGIIRELSTELSNKIAAGEVVERPASVVKELVENSIDAGASSITVRIERGGISRIQVTDDGCGMMREDALACFGRHATSKISTAADLDAIYTMGFRGEALSSISAVSQVDLYTKRTQDAAGIHVVCADGEIQSCAEEGMPDGTTFVVSNIFYNIPARMKFLKRDATEASYITDVMARMILSHPEISFRYINSRKEIYFSPGDKELINSVYTVYGKDYAKNVIPVDYTYEHIKVTGLAGKSETVRPNRAYQNFFVNKRCIKSPLITKAVEEGYKNQVMSGKFPMVVLNIDIDASMIDINVHPTKQEVKFSNESMVYSAVYHAIQNALHSEYSVPLVEKSKTEQKSSAFKADIVKSDMQYELEWAKNKDRWTPANEVPKKIETKSDEEKTKDFPDSYKCDVSPEYFEKRRMEILQNEKKPDVFGIPLIREDTPKPDDFEIPNSRTPFADAVKKSLKPEADEIGKEPEEKDSFSVPADISGQNEPDIKADRPFKIIGQLFDTYVLVESEDELLIIDQHAAHERIKYEELLTELKNKRVAAQDLMIPVTVNLTPLEYDIYSQNKDLLENIGFEADDFGDNSIVVRTAPASVDYDDIDQLMAELLEQISQNKEKPISHKAEYALYTIACKAAVKANHDLDIKELEALLKSLFAIRPINTCPHGRPITISMTKKEIEKEFKRIL